MNKYNAITILLSFLFFTTQTMEITCQDPIKNLISDCKDLTTQEIIKRLEQGSVGKEFQTKLLFLKSLQYSSLYADPTYMPYNRTHVAFENTLKRLKQLLQSNEKSEHLKNFENKKNVTIDQYQFVARILNSLYNILNENYIWAQADIKDGIAQTVQEKSSTKTKKTSKKNPLIVYMAADNDLREFAIAKECHFHYNTKK